MAKAAKASDTWTLRSKPPYEHIDGIEYFYDGEVPVRDGVIVIPKNNVWASRLLFQGYAWDGGIAPEDFNDVL